MSNDLISRSALLEEMKNVPPNAYTPGHMMYLAENAPTAYDVDKVVDRLERVSVEEPLTDNGVKVGTVKVIPLKNAVEIVKGGVEE